MPRKLLVVIIFSTFLAFALSLIPTLSAERVNGDLPAFHEFRQTTLTQENLVDLFTLTPTHYNIKRVKWENRAIYVDFSVTPAEKVDLSLYYYDVYALIHKTFRWTNNVDHLYIRLLDDVDQTSRLLIALQANRPQTIRDLPAPDRVKDTKLFVEKTFQVRIEPALSDRISPYD